MSYSIILDRYNAKSKININQNIQRKEEYWDYIINRRDLLVPPDIRSRKGSFFTPQIWAEKSQEYLASVLGKRWQEEYHIWDLAAGTCNLLAGLTNVNNIWASTIDQADVDIMLARLRSGSGMFRNHIFKFDFLNDDFSKLPRELKRVIDEKPEKLIIYINPPYAEAGNIKKMSGTGEHKDKVSLGNKTYEKYKDILGNASNEVFSQFFIRIYKEIPNCILATFSKLKYINATNFAKFREVFKAKFLKGFIVPANTFDNVNGKFPIGFLIWDTSKKQKIKNVKVDIFDCIKVNKTVLLSGKKIFYSDENVRNINNWLKEFKDKSDKILGVLMADAPDFQHNNHIAIINQPLKAHLIFQNITYSNLIPFCIYLSVRLYTNGTWINDNDDLKNNDNLFESKNFIPTKPLKFSKEAKDVFEAGKKLWKYYHTTGSYINNNASYYDIRKYFQGTDANGRMNNKSIDEEYNKLIKDLRDKMDILAKKIEPKIYEYGFLNR